MGFITEEGLHQLVVYLNVLNVGECKNIINYKKLYKILVINKKNS